MKTAFVVLIALVLVIGSSLACQTGWSQYSGSCYGLGQDTVTWYEAAATCSAQGATLVEIGGWGENNFVKNLAKSKGATVWIGGNDIFKEGSFTWPSGNRVSYSDYSSYQPDNNKGAEDCLSLRDTYGYKWNDAPCTMKYKFICEQRA